MESSHWPHSHCSRWSLQYIQMELSQQWEHLNSCKHRCSLRYIQMGDCQTLEHPSMIRRFTYKRVNVNQIHPAWSTQFANLSPHQQNSFYGAHRGFLLHPGMSSPSRLNLRPLLLSSSQGCSFLTRGLQTTLQQRRTYLKGHVVFLSKIIDTRVLTRLLNFTCSPRIMLSPRTNSLVIS